MKRHIEARMPLFLRSYFLSTRIAFVKKKTEENSAHINAYKTLMMVLAYYFRLPKANSRELLNHIEKFNAESGIPYQRFFGEVIRETLTFIHQQLLLTIKEEHSLRERYV